MKKVLFIVIDAIATRIVEPAIRDGKLPNMGKLVSAGRMQPRCTAVFPSITPAATASLVTGRYPLEHEIAGNYWYDVRQDQVAYYGDDFWTILNKGLGRFFHDFMISLNYERLKANTLFETIERQGLQTACINFMWIRGDEPHDLNAPFLLKLLPGIEFPDRLSGPRTLLLGDFIADSGAENGFSAPGGLMQRFGFDDESTSAYLLQYARNQKLTDFTLAYFPDNDFDSHKDGPAEALATLEKVDRTLGELFDVWGGHDAMLEELAVFITGDHSQSDLVADESRRSIRLEELLAAFRLTDAGEKWSDGDELMVCPNMRAVQIYLRSDTEENRARVIERLLDEDRVDQVLWDNRDEVASSDGARHWWVATSDRGRLEFWQGMEDVESVTDQHGNRWGCRGDLSALDASAHDGAIRYGAYPNALERIANGPGDMGGDIWATARVGYEFSLPSTELHQHGSHGSLHELDSTSPLIVAGLPNGVSVPSEPRSVDVAKICLDVLGLSESP